MMEEIEEREGIMFFRLDAYLDDLKHIQNAMPKDERKRVPTMTELAEEIGISKTNFSRMVRGHVQSINYEIGGNLIRALRRRGFDTRFDDIFGYEEHPRKAGTRKRAQAEQEEARG